MAKGHPDERMAEKKRTPGEVAPKRPKISSSHTTPLAAKSAAASPRSAEKKPRAATSSADPTAKPTGKPAAKTPRQAPLNPASKPIPRASTATTLPTTRKSALQTAATTGKKANKSAGLPAPERKEADRRKPGRPAQGEDAIREAKERALQVVAAGLDKKASDVSIIDVCGKVDYADFLVLMTGTSDRHVASIVQSVEDDQQKRGQKALSVEGLPIANWVLVDFADVVVHVFQEDARGMYDLDGLWMDAQRIPFEP